MNRYLLPPKKWQSLLPLVAVLLAVALVLYADPAWAQETAEKVAKKSTVGSQLFTPFFYTRLITDLVSVVVLVMFLYLPIHRKKDYFFTFLILNFLVFIITFLINKTNAFSSMGRAFGLLAFFSLLRLRTETITMKDMTYLFVVLTIGLVNALPPPSPAPRQPPARRCMAPRAKTCSQTGASPPTPSKACAVPGRFN